MKKTCENCAYGYCCPDDPVSDDLPCWLEFDEHEQWEEDNILGEIEDFITGKG
jgi:hypothetical protein